MTITITKTTRTSNPYSAMNTWETTETYMIMIDSDGVDAKVLATAIAAALGSE